MFLFVSVHITSNFWFQNPGLGALALGDIWEKVIVMEMTMEMEMEIVDMYFDNFSQTEQSIGSYFS